MSRGRIVRPGVRVWFDAVGPAGGSAPDVQAASASAAPRLKRREAVLTDAEDSAVRARHLARLGKDVAMTPTGVAFVMYPVSDMQRSIAFYRDVLGFEKSGIDNDFWVEFDVNGTTFGIGNFEQTGKPGTAQSFAVEVNDMSATRAELAKHGVESSDPFETPVCFISMLKDPDGNQICLHQSKPRA